MAPFETEVTENELLEDESGMQDQSQEIEREYDQERDENYEPSAEIPDSVKIRGRVATPSAKEVELHNRLYFPYRAWCPVCVGARGVDPQVRGVV